MILKVVFKNWYVLPVDSQLTLLQICEIFTLVFNYSLFLILPAILWLSNLVPCPNKRTEIESVYVSQFDIFYHYSLTQHADIKFFGVRLGSAVEFHRYSGERGMLYALKPSKVMTPPVRERTGDNFLTLQLYVV